MKSAEILIWMLLLCLLLPVGLRAQTPATSPTQAIVPRLIKFNGTLLDEANHPMKGPVGVTFALYSQQSGGAALWTETQNVKPDAAGNYTVLLGSASANGIPAELFASGEARWLGVQAEGQAEQPGVLFVSVPYALKASDAQTLAGLPASAFLMASSQFGKAPAPVSAPVVTTPLVAQPSSIIAAPTGSGTGNTIPLWTSSTNLGNSNITQVTGIVSVKDTLQLPATGTATSTLKFNSQPLDLLASSFNSTLSTAINQHFRWQAEPVGNDTASPSGKLNLLYAPGATTPAETGLSISSKGLFSFAPGQTFPGTGTVTSVGLSAPPSDFKVSGSPVTKSGTLALSWNVAPTSADIKNAIVKRDSGGSFHAGQIFGDLGVEGITALTCASCAGVSGVNTGGGIGMYAQGGGGLFATASSGVGVWGQSSGTSGGSDGVHGVTSSAGASGVAGVNTSGIFGSVGVYGTGGTGIFGTSPSATGIGVNGVGGGNSTTGAGTCCAGVWGDTGRTGDAGVLGTADDSTGVEALTNSGTDTFTAALVGINVSSTAGAMAFLAGGPLFSNTCTIDVSGDLMCTGSKSAVVPVENGQKMVALYAEESPENWFADYGSGHLVNGIATVALEPTFAQTVNTSLDYHVFPVPNGDCNGLYVTNKTASSFQVRELKSGHSNIGFDYRIIAKRKGYEKVRLEDKTAMRKAADANAARFKRKPAAAATLRTPAIR